ncbi:hypothetical protein ACIGW8_37475 [Streptomyces sioyaensis]|uniref:hypothetical protein n=1 Tax=Streptomyces sioyaensis TaxID=67364 RepID=UPI0037D352CD
MNVKRMTRGAAVAAGGAVFFAATFSGTATAAEGADGACGVWNPAGSKYSWNDLKRQNPDYYGDSKADKAADTILYCAMVGSDVKASSQLVGAVDNFREWLARFDSFRWNHYKSDINSLSEFLAEETLSNHPTHGGGWFQGPKWGIDSDSEVQKKVHDVFYGVLQGEHDAEVAAAKAKAEADAAAARKRHEELCEDYRQQRKGAWHANGYEDGSWGAQLGGWLGGLINHCD